MTDVLVKPAFIATQTDSGDATKLGPNAWNASRLFSAGNAGDVLVRDLVSQTGASWVSSPTFVNLTLATSASIVFGSNGALVGGADGQFVYRNNANTASISFGYDRILLNHNSTGNAIIANGAGIFLFANEAQTIGFTLNGATADVCKIRNRGNSAYATMDALGYSVGGVAGASKGAGPVTSITVVNGIVTACT